MDLEELIKDTREKFPLTLKVKHVAEITNLHESTVYELLAQGKIPMAKKMFNAWRIPRDSFLLWWNETK